MIRLALTLIFITLALPARATTWTVDTEHSNVLFHVRHFVSKVSGRFSDFGGSVVFDSDKTENNNILFEIRTESISTDHKVRDDHLRSAAFFIATSTRKPFLRATAFDRWAKANSRSMAPSNSEG